MASKYDDKPLDRPTNKRLNLVVGDPVGKAYPHLNFSKEGSKWVGEVKEASEFADSKFRSFSYARTSSEAYDCISMEFYDRVMRSWK